MKKSEWSKTQVSDPLATLHHDHAWEEQGQNNSNHMRQTKLYNKWV